MGIFDKLKSVKNFVTGGGAEVHAQLPDVLVRGESATVSIRAEIKDASMDVSSVYINVRASETIDMVVEDNDDYHDLDRIYENNETFSDKFSLNIDQTLDAGQEYEWEIEIIIPEDARASYSGVYASNDWEIEAGIDVKGNDPDSGWIEIQVI